MPLFAVLLLLFALLAAQQFRAASRKGGGNAYFAAESRMTLLATALFVGAVFLCDLRWHLQPLSVGGSLPTLAQGGGLMLFFLFLLLLWRAAQPSYRKIFGCKRSPMGFAAASLRSNLPLVLPWFFLSLTFDLFYLLPWPAARQMLRPARLPGPLCGVRSPHLHQACQRQKPHRDKRVAHALFPTALHRRSLPMPRHRPAKARA